MPGRKHRPATGFLEECLISVRKHRHQEPQEDHAVSKPGNGS